MSDGAWGTFLQKKGLKPGECPELWCIERPEEVLDVARSYVDAGADMIESNSFGGGTDILRSSGSVPVGDRLDRADREDAGDGGGDGGGPLRGVQGTSDGTG